MENMWLDCLVSIIKLLSSLKKKIHRLICVTLSTELDTLWLLPRNVKSAVLNLTNGTLVDKGGFEHQSYWGSTLIQCLFVVVLKGSKRHFLAAI